jgi:hypothetical protein
MESSLVCFLECSFRLLYDMLWYVFLGGVYLNAVDVPEMLNGPVSCYLGCKSCAYGPVRQKLTEKDDCYGVSISYLFIKDVKRDF